MGNNNWLEQITKQAQVGQLLETNQYTERFGLVLEKEDAVLLAEAGSETLRETQRIELGQGILPRIIYAFCDSAYIMQENYCESLIRLQEIFFLYKNEMLDEITDDELLAFMKEQFENICFGDFDYLEGTCLDIFAQAVRAGYAEPAQEKGFQDLDIVKRWDKDLYLETLRDLCWR